jgi:hypothetical protein
VEALAELRKLAAKNRTAVQMIGQGYFDTVTPPVIRRNILESPAWYTAYTPYQPEISQGRLEALLNFQTMVQDLVGLPIANASLLDEATAVAEAVLMMRRANKNKDARDGKTVLDADCLPQTIAIVKGRAEALGFEVEIADLSAGLPEGAINGIVLQQPGVSGRVFDHSAVIGEAKERGALVTVAADLLALTLITPPGSRAPISPSAPPSVLASRCSSAARTPRTWQSRRGSSAPCPAAWWACPRTTPVSPPTGLRCRPANSTSGARRRRRTFAPRRPCWPSLRRCTPFTTAPRG